MTMPTLLRKTVPAALLAFGLLAACVAHDKAGDQYAAAGDWKNAYAHYRQAAADKPGDPALQQKLEQARTRAVADAAAQAQNCERSRQWDCALQESDFVVSVEPARSDMAEIKRRASTEVALARLGQVPNEVAAGRFPAAAGLIQQARQLSNDPAVEAEARRATQAYSRGVLDTSSRMRQQRKYQDAVALLQGAVQVDPGLRRDLEDTQREFEGWKGAEHDRYMAEGDGHVAAGRWPDAQRAFQQANQMRNDERARASEAYAREMGNAEEAARRSDWAAAARSYRAAAALRVDRGQAADLADKVEPRPWSVSIRTVIVTPLRPNRQPWVGPPDRRLDKLQEVLADRWSDPLAGKVLLALSKAPSANLTNLAIEVTLPDGTRLATKPDRGFQIAPRAVFVVNGNVFEKAKVGFRVFHQLAGGQPEDVGYADAPIGELITRRTLVLQDRAVGAIELTVDSAEGSRPGSFTGLTQTAGPTVQAPPAKVEPARPPPPPPPPAGKKR
jgi:tetratricopeptide (TPR) repeat protein